jgi:hypothetical protein
MTRVTPPLLVDFIKTLPPDERHRAESDLAPLMRPPFHTLDHRFTCRGLPAPIGLLDYALRFGSPASVELMLEAGADPNGGSPRPLTLLTMTHCRDEGRIEKLEVLLRAEAKTKTDYVERAERVPATPLIGLARSKIRGIQRYWLCRILAEAGAPPIALNEYELHVMTRLLAEQKALDGIMERLPAEEQEATKSMPGSLIGLVGAVLRRQDPIALSGMIAARDELKLPFELDVTAMLRALAKRIADTPVGHNQAGFVRALLAAGAEVQAEPGADSAFERALQFENHELIEIFLDAGARPERASDADLVFELMRRQGLPQQPKGSIPIPRRASTEATSRETELAGGPASGTASPQFDRRRPGVPDRRH